MLTNPALILPTGQPLQLQDIDTASSVAAKQLTVAHIAHALANTNLFGGHARRPISLAEHALLVVEILERECPACGPQVLLAALMRDAHHAAAGYLVPAVADHVGAPWRWWVGRCALALRAEHDLLPVFREHEYLLRHADACATATELRDLFPAGAAQHAPWAAGAPVAWLRLQERDHMGWADWRDAWADHYHALAFGAREPIGQPPEAPITTTGPTP